MVKEIHLFSKILYKKSGAFRAPLNPFFGFHFLFLVLLGPLSPVFALYYNVILALQYQERLHRRGDGTNQEGERVVRRKLKKTSSF